MSHLFNCLLLVLGISQLSEAKVEFTFSTLYNIFDFEGVEKIPLARCNNGCLIFASTVSSYEPGYDGQETYFKNLLIYDPISDRNFSIAELAVQTKPGGSQKMFLEMVVPATYSMLNINAVTDKGRDVTVWIIDRTKGHEIDFEIYDAATMNRAVALPNTVVTVMSAGQFRVLAEPEYANSYTTYLVGFDNAADTSPDMCKYAYMTRPNSKFDGFELHVNAPIISIVFNEKTPVDLKADLHYTNARNLTNSGFVSSPGYNGCGKIAADQVHRSKQYVYSDEYDFFGAPEFFKVDFDVDLNLAVGHELTVTDLSKNQIYPIGGFGDLQMKLDETQSFSLKYADITPPQSFMMRFTSSKLLKETTQAPKTTTGPYVTLSTTSSVDKPTTSAAGSIGGFVATGVFMLRILL